MEEKLPKIYKNFHSVICGKKVTKRFYIENTTDEKQTYTIVKKKGPQIYDSRLEIIPTQLDVSPGSTVCFKINYRNFVNGIIDNFFFEIYDSEKTVGLLHVRAKSVGPYLGASVYNLKFFCFRDYCQLTKHLEFNNTTKCSANYQFEDTGDSPRIEVNEKSGKIPAELKLSLKFTYIPKEQGIFYKQMYCIVEYHQPIIINVLAINKPNHKIDPRNLNYKYPPLDSNSNNYTNYMAKLNLKIPQEETVPFIKKCAEECDINLDDETKVEKIEEVKSTWSFTEETGSKEIVSDEKGVRDIILTTYFVDIGNENQVSKVTTLANFSSYKRYYFQWDHDPKNHFEIEPCRGYADPKKVVNFCLYFNPTKPDMMYHAELDLRIFPVNVAKEKDCTESVALPFSVTLKIIGNSFPDDSYGWIPQCTAGPKILQLRNCVPGEMVYATFNIERTGHLPVTFITVLQENSNYLVQPPLGFIEGNIQLLVVQFNAVGKEPGVYHEEMRILYNNSNANCDIIKFTTTVEEPVLIIGNDYTYMFEPTFPGSVISTKILIDNPTSLKLSFQFIVPKNLTWLRFTNPSGVIDPKAIRYVAVTFQPKSAGEFLGYVPCKIASVSFPSCSVELHTQFIGSSQYGYLVANPSTHDFGSVTYRMPQTIKIYLFNFSFTMLNFRLHASYQSSIFTSVNKDVVINPKRGKIYPKSKFLITVTIIPHDREIHDFVIISEILEDDSKSAKPCGESKKIFKGFFEGFLPGFQIIDLSIDGGGPLFSPHWMWKMLSINKLNSFLNSLRTEEQLQWRFPEAPQNAPPITIALLLEANEHGETEFKIRKRIFCPCGLSTEKPLLEMTMCEHDRKINMKPMKGILQSKKRLIMQIVSRYAMVEDCQIEWTIFLPYGRKIILDAQIISLPLNDITTTSTYLEPKIDLMPIYIGDTDPLLQLYWLYNNSANSTPYIVDKFSLRESTVNAKVFDCINPNGILPPFSCLPLGFIFRPKEIMLYKANILMCVHDTKMIHITLAGEGLPYTQQFYEMHLEKTVPEKPVLYNANVALECNVNLLNIKFFKTFSTVKRIFYLKNKSSSQVWAYHWHNFKVDNLITATITPFKGTVQPLEEITMMLILKSSKYPTKLSFSIPCDVINHTELIQYNAVMRKNETEMEKMKDYFIITEKGESLQVPELKEYRKPEPKHLFLTVNTNIMSSHNTEQKLNLKQQLSLKSRIDLEPFEKTNVLYEEEFVPIARTILEKILWNILNSSIFKHRVELLKEVQDYSYLQIRENDCQKMLYDVKTLTFMPSMCYIQSFLENLILEILKRKKYEAECESRSGT